MPASTSPTPDSPGPSAGALMLSPATPLPPPPSTSSPGCGSTNPEQAGPGAPAATVAASGNPETEEDKAKKLLYCSLCKVAVNSLSQLEAHNKGELHLQPCRCQKVFFDATSELLLVPLRTFQWNTLTNPLLFSNKHQLVCSAYVRLLGNSRMFSFHPVLECFPLFFLNSQFRQCTAY